MKSPTLKSMPRLKMLCVNELDEHETAMPHTKPLFIPLNSDPYEQFEMGYKLFELRRDKAPWTKKNCFDGRAVILSKGYGKKNRLNGRVLNFESMSGDWLSPNDRATFDSIYPGWIAGGGRVAAIRIHVEGRVCP